MNNNKISLPYMLYDTDCKEYVYSDEVHTLFIVFINYLFLNLLGNPCYSNLAQPYDKLEIKEVLKHLW